MAGAPWRVRPVEEAKRLEGGHGRAQWRVGDMRVRARGKRAEEESRKEGGDAKEGGGPDGHAR